MVRIRNLFILIVCLLWAETAKCQFAKHLVIVMQNGYWGLIDEEGKVYEKCIYKAASQEFQYTTNINARFWDGENIISYFNSQKYPANPKGYCHWNQLSNTRYSAGLNGRYYLTDKLGNKIIEQDFDYILKTLVSDVFEFCAGGKNGLINSNGQIIREFPLLPMRLNSNKFFYVQQQNNMVIYNYQGIKIAEDSFVSVESLNTDSVCLVANYKHSGGAIFNNYGEVIFKYPANSKIISLKQNFIGINNNKKWKVLNLDKNQTLPGVFDYVQQGNFKNAFIYTQNKRKFIYCRLFPDSTIGPFKEIQSHEKGAWIKNEYNLYGFFDTNLKTALPFKFPAYKNLIAQYWTLTDSNQNQAIFNFTTLKSTSDFIYNEFALGDDYVKAYTGGGEMDLYDIANNTLSAPIRYKNIRRRKINQRIEVDTTAIDSNTNSVVRRTTAGRYYWSYIKCGREQLLAMLYSDSNKHVDTLIKPFGHELYYNSYPYAIITHKNPAYPSVVEKQNRRYFIVDLRNYTINPEPYDYVETSEITNPKSTVFLAVKNNGKSVFIDKETLAESEEYEFISNLEFDCRRVVKSGKRIANKNIKHLIYLGTKYISSGDIYGIWGITDINGNPISIEKTNPERVTFIDQFRAKRAYVYDDSGHVMLITNTGKIMIPPQYYDIQNIYFQSDNYYYLAKKPAPANVYLYHPQTSGLCQQYMGTADLKQCIAVIDNKDQWLIKPDGKKLSIPSNCELKPFKNGLSFMKQDKGWVPVNMDLQPINTLVLKKVIYGLPTTNFYLAAQGNKWGVLNEKAEWVLMPSLQGVPGPIYYTSFKLNIKNNISLVLFNGQTVPKPENYAIALEEIAPDIFLFQNKTNYIFSTNAGKIIARVTADEQPIYLNGFVLYKHKEREMVMNLKSGQSTYLPPKLSANQIINNQYYAIENQEGVAAFNDIQKSIKPELKGFISFRFKNTRNNGAKNQYTLNKQGLYLAANDDNQHFQLISGETANYPLINRIMNMDSIGILVNAYGRTGLLNYNGTWAIPPFYPNLLAMGNGYFAAKTDWIYELWDMNGNKVAYPFKGFMQHAHSLSMVNGNEMKLYNFESKKFITLPAK